MRILLILLAIAGLGGLGLWAAGGGLGGDDASAAVEGVEVQRGPLRIGVVESGNLKAANSVEIKSELEGSSTILFLVEEGSRVEPGDLLVELDATDLLDRKVSQEITVENAKGALVKAEQNLAIQKSQNESDIAIAERTLEFAQNDLLKYTDGDWPQQRQAAEDDILLAEEELKRAADKLKWSEDLAEKRFLTRTELEADQLNEQRAEITLAQRKRALELLETYDNPRQVRSFEADVAEAKRELERVKLQAAARLVDFEANVRSANATYELEADKLQNQIDQLEKSRIFAPTEGLVVYATEGGRRGNDDPIAEGTTVRERQDIITIPSSNEMIVEAKLHESVVQQVAVGQDVLIRVDALPGVEYAGRVNFKAVLPDQNSWWGNPNLRVYRCEIEVLDPDAEMRPGMSCSIEVVVAELEDAVHVPVQAVVVSGGRPVCFVRDGGSVEVREVEVGLHNSTWVEVTSGLEGGELVMLSPPEGFEVEYELRTDDEAEVDGGAVADGSSSKARPASAGGESGRPTYGAGASGGGSGWSGKPGSSGGQRPATGSQESR